MIDSITVCPGRIFVVLTAFLLFFFAGCRPPPEEKPRFYLDPGNFNPTNALAEVKALTAIRPRHSGSPGALKAAEHLVARLCAAGIAASLDEFEEETPAGKIVFRNVIGSLPGRDTNDRPVVSWIVLAAHYDTKSGIAQDFEGANDSGSGVGMLLELARVIKNSADLPANFVFAFLDGEECVNHYDENDGLHGSRHLAGQLVKDGRSRKARAVIILDMVGDRDLNITIPRNSVFSLVSALFGAAEAEGTRAQFSLSSGPILDDHEPFISAGMPAIDIIDFEYGSRPGWNDYWHTPQDTLDKLSVSSLETVGRTTLRFLDHLLRVPPRDVPPGDVPPGDYRQKSALVKGGESAE